MKRLALALVLGLVLAVALAACGEDEEDAAVATVAPDPAAVVQPTALPAEVMTPSKYSEAPELAELVKAGKLPPVEERLPDEPMVIQVVDEIGTYGGQIRKAYKGGHLSCNFGRPIRDGLVRPSMDGNSVVMAVAESITPDAEGKAWTIKLRKGMKWSDGAPFTADDFTFQYERLMDEELTLVKPLYITAGNTVGKVRKIDEFTVETSYEIPNWTFLDTLFVMEADCGRPGRPERIPYTPSHYMKQFYPKYAEGGKAAVEKAAKAAGLETWMQLYTEHDVTLANPDRPTTRMLVLDSGITGKRIIGNRNPYFYAVDPAGNQLPYIGRWVWDKVEDAAATGLKALAGEIDFQSRSIELMDVPLYTERGIRLVMWPSFEENDAALAFNITLQTPPGDYYRMEDFRHALSYAIDKEKINLIAFLGTGVVRNLMPPKGHPYYPGPELEFKYMEHDPQKAMEMLDKIMPDKNSEGFRLMSNGEPIDIQIWTPKGDIAEMVVNDWAKVGIKATNKAQLTEAKRVGQKDGTLEVVLEHHGASGMIFSYPDKLIPVYGNQNAYAPAFGYYFESGGEKGIKPIPEIQEMLDNYLAGPSLPDEERYAMGRKIYAQLAEKQYIINLVANSPTSQGVHVVNEHMRNVPEKAANSWPYRAPSTGYPEQFFYAPAYFAE